MGKSILRSVGAIVGLGWLFAACSGTGTAGGGPIITGSTAGSGSGAIGGNGGSGGSVGSLCAPGTKRCDALNVKLCDETGFNETIAQTCAPSQACSGGACVASACVPNTTSCKDGAVWTCDANGASTLTEQCAFGLSCRVEDDSASCNPQACSPNQPVCDGNVATLCRADGSGPASGGVDCKNSKQACYSGKCQDIACSNGEKLCDHGSVYLCSHNGTDISLLSTCRSDEVCDADMGSCRSKLCDPGKVSCDGTRTQTCNAFGSAWLPGSVECAADGKICVSGSCKKQVCAASRSYCQDGNVYSCDATGTLATLTQTCAQTEHCTTYSSGSFGYCKANDCHAGDTLCDNNMIKVCNSDGSLPSTGTACGDNQVCENAQCKDRPCVAGSYFCKGVDVYYCDYNSPYLYLSQQCSGNTACKPLGNNSATCSPLACSPNSNTCLGNKIGTCASDGQSLSVVSSDCTTSTSICTADLTCAKSALDTVGGAESPEPVYTGTLVGDVIDVDSARKLTELQINLVLTGPRQLRWIIYEAVGQYFVGKFDQIVAVKDTGFASSGPLSFSLAAGKRYLLAVVITGGDAVDYIDIQPFTGDISFGTVVGRVYSYSPNSVDAYSYDSSYVSQMKVLTEPL